MSVHSAQTIAANMTLIVVALLAVTLIVIVPTWKRFLAYWNETPPKPWRRIFLGSILLVGWPVLFLFAALISLWISTDTWYLEFRYVLILMLLALSLPIYFYIIPRWLFRELSRTKNISARLHNVGHVLSLGFGGIYFSVLFRRLWRGLRHPKSSSRRRPDISKEIGTLAALACFLETIVLTLAITMAAVPIAIGVDIGGQPQEENFEFARAMIIVMPITLACGLGCLALSYFEEFRQRVAASKE